MHSTLRIALPLLALAAASCPEPLAAQGPCKAASSDCVIVGEWDISVAIGAGLRSNPVAGRTDLPLIVIPQVSYYGRRFFLENLEPGITLYEGAAHTFNLIAAPGYDRAFFDRDDPQNIFVPTLFTGPVAEPEPGPGSGEGPPPDEELPPGEGLPPPEVLPGVLRKERRHTTYLAGPEWSFTYRRFIGQVNALYEVSGRHEGYEVRAAIAAPLIQAEHSVVLNAGWTWKSAATVDYYYGVDGLYKPGAAFSPFLKVGLTRRLSDRWTVVAFVHYEYLGGAIADSPIVSERAVVTAFAGLNFKML